MTIEKKEFAEKIADYVAEHSNYTLFTKREAVIAAVNVLTDDIGAANDFLNCIGVKEDLYLKEVTDGINAAPAGCDR